MEKSGNMLFGRFDALIGKKHRTSFPKKFTDALGNKLIITKGLEECLVITTEEMWQEMLKGIEEKPFTNSAKRELQRFLFGNAALLELDNLRRFIIPEYLLIYASLIENVVFIGVNDRVELWNKDKWEERQKQISPNVSEIAEKLGEVRHKDE